jgi:hypothetical protein
MEMLSFAQTLRDYAEKTGPVQTRSTAEAGHPSSKGFWRGHQRLVWITAIAAMLVTVAGGSLLLRKEWQKRRDAAALQGELAALNPPGDPRPEVATTLGPLQPGLVRGNGSSQGYAIPANADAVQLIFGVPPDDTAAYQVRKETDEGITLFSLPHLKPTYANGEKQVLVSLPGRILQPGNHYFRVSVESDSGELKDVGVYYLKVVR